MKFRSWLLAAISIGSACLPLRAIDPKNFDTSVAPKDDFYRYANGTWLKQHPIPPAYTSWDNIEVMNERVENSLRAVMEKAAHPDATRDALNQKVGDFYASGLDQAAIEKAGLTALEPTLREISAVKSIDDLPLLIAHLHEQADSALFTFNSGQDEKNSQQVIAIAGQGGLSLPDRDYYTRDDADSVKLRGAFEQHVARAFILLGDDPKIAPSEATALLELETKMARASKTSVELREPEPNYHKLTLTDFQKLTPHFLWNHYLESLHVSIDSLDVGQPEYFHALDGLITQTPLESWKLYFRYHVLSDSASYLAKQYDDEFFSFYGKTLSGAQEHHERWKRVLSTVSASIDQLVGQLYVRNNFSADSKKRMLALIANLRATLRERLEHVTWMDEATRRAALAKLDKLGVKVGYPDKWINYDSLQITRESYIENIFHANVFNVHRDLAKIGHPVDRLEWDMSPQTVNAYYSQNMNEIVFPAAILSTPFFDPNASDAENYGAIGAVIGHEMTHGFDDNGRQYDGHGNLRNWWTAASTAKFKERSAAIVKQFNGYEVLNGLHLNGELTQGENIADLGGVKIALAALERTSGFAHAAPDHGFTPTQIFFLSYATVWRTNIRPESLRMDVNTDVHSPAEFRVDGPLSNLDAFYKAFSIPEGAPMRRPAAERVEIW
jgi:predicted metalloendopeptidase